MANWLARARAIANADPDDGTAAVLATPEQVAELRELIAIILAEDTGADRAEALAVALADHDAALTSFRALAAERARNLDAAATPKPANVPGDMRTCNDCLNLPPSGRCLAAWRGESFGPGMAVGRSWSPAMTDRPQRCALYRPGPSDTDRRTGLERWPWLLHKANM